MDRDFEILKDRASQQLKGDIKSTFLELLHTVPKNKENYRALNKGYSLFRNDPKFLDILKKDLSLKEASLVDKTGIYYPGKQGHDSTDEVEAFKKKHSIRPGYYGV